jgi:hypothetical protein
MLSGTVMEDGTYLIQQARRMVYTCGGLTPTMTFRLDEAGYEPGHVAALVAIWREQVNSGKRESR